MTRSNSQNSVENAARAEEHAVVSQPIAAGVPPAIPVHMSKSEPNEHVSPDAGTDDGATDDGAIPAEKNDAKIASGAANNANETVSMGSPAFDLRGRPVSKDTIHSNS